MKACWPRANRYRGLIDIQLVAFPQEGILKSSGTVELMRKAMEMGADVVGGMPFNENNPTDSWRHIEIAFEIARQFGAAVDMHVDETDDAGARTLEMLADQTIANGYEGRVSAGHTALWLLIRRLRSQSHPEGQVRRTSLS